MPPVSTVQVQQVAADISELCPAWAEAPVSTAATYLGFSIGPGKHGVQWDAVATNMLERAGTWDWQSMGLHFATVVHNSFISSVPAFKLQLEDMTEEVLAAEQWTMHRAVPGPGNSVSQKDLWNLRRVFGMPVDFASLKDVAIAAKGRVYLADSMRPEGPLVHLTPASFVGTRDP